MDNLLAKQMPEKMQEFSVNPDNLRQVPVAGAFWQNVTVRGKKRRFITYIPENMSHCRPCIVAALPSGESILEYMEKSRLKAFADKKKLFLFVLVPEGDAWDLSGTDADYMNMVYVEAQARDYYVTMQDNFYALGVGDGADVAQQAACRMSSEWSGLMTIGDLSVNLQEIQPNKDAAGMDGGELYIAAEKTQLPVWMVVSCWEGRNVEVADYWRRNNRTGDEEYRSNDADHIWIPEALKQDLEMNEELVSQVRITVRNTECSAETMEMLWSYIGLSRRHRGQGKKNLRVYKDPIACGAVYRTCRIGGLMREWYEYVPSCCTPDRQWPLVVVMHGRGGTAETFFDISNMFQVANRRKFIAVFPQAGVYQQKKDGLNNVASWDGVMDETPIDDVTFIRTVIEDMENRYPIDRGRIYACGQSSGGMMTDTLCECLGSLFAATASWSALYTPARAYINRERVEDAPPTMLIFGENDNLIGGTSRINGVPFTVAEEFRQAVEDKFQRYGLDKDEVQTWRDYPITWYAYPNAQGVPMFTVGIVDNMIHANYPEESWISYDQFFCQFSRDEEGNLYYRGQRVSTKKGE